MMIFFGDESKVAIPSSRIYKVLLSGNKITVYYDGGDISWLNENVAVPQILDATIYYESAELATKNFRDYYAACDLKKGAFYFG